MTFKQSLLWPFALLYGAAAHFRARAYACGLFRQRRLDGLVISVGNLTTGGTGKTPMVLWLAEHLLAEGKRPGILTRGYRGFTSAAGPSSDEAQLLAARLGDAVPIGVGANRFTSGRALAGRGVDCFILDDGFQHLRLARDVDIVLIDATNPFGGGHLLPAGRLREPRWALARAHVIIITRSPHAPAIEVAVRRYSDAPIFYAAPRLDSVRTFREGSAGDEAADARSKNLFAFCGIGNPAAFLADLRAWGFRVAGRKFFPDHHRYSNEDAQAIEAAARRAGADALICTEKDIFNLSSAHRTSDMLFFCRTSFHPDHPDDLLRTILASAKTRR